jgi:hypothetical protein
MPDREQRVSEGYVFSMGEQLLHRLRIAIYGLTQRYVISLDQLVYIIYRSYLEITSIVGTSSSRPLPRGGESSLPI